MRQSIRRAILLGGLGLLASTQEGCRCAHTREVLYPGGTTATSPDEVRVRAPFVDVRVPKSSRRDRDDVDRRKLEIDDLDDD